MFSDTQSHTYFDSLDRGCLHLLLYRTYAAVHAISLTAASHGWRQQQLARSPALDV